MPGRRLKAGWDLTARQLVRLLTMPITLPRDPSRPWPAPGCPVAGSRASLAVAGDLDALLDDLRTAVGEDAVITDEMGLTEYLDPYSPLARGQDMFRAAAAVRPASTEEVQAVVRIAARHRRSVWPISTGRNLAYGGPAPGTPNAVMLDLRRMNRVLEVSERYAYALVEPGVSYFDLHKFIAAHYPQLWVDVPDLGWGSP